MTNRDSKSYFLSVIEPFTVGLERAVDTSESRLGITHTGRQNRVLTAYAKTIAHAMSIQLLYGNSVQEETEPGFLDHFSIGVLTRTLIDASIMTLYLSEPSLSEAEWDLRRHILFLHDASNRKRFLKAMHEHVGKNLSADDLDTHRKNKDGVIQIIMKRGEELGLSRGRLEELSKGHLVFIEGIRGAVREAGIDVKGFEFLYTYFSNHVHSHPVSLLRNENFSFDAPTDFQLGFCALCLETATNYLEAATSRVDLFTGDMARDPNGHLE